MSSALIKLQENTRQYLIGSVRHLRCLREQTQPDLKERVLIIYLTRLGVDAVWHNEAEGIRAGQLLSNLPLASIVHGYILGWTLTPNPRLPQELKEELLRLWSEP